MSRHDVLTEWVRSAIHDVLRLLLLLHVLQHPVILLHHLIAFVHQFAVLHVAFEVRLERHDEVTLAFRLLISQIVVKFGLLRVH